MTTLQAVGLYGKDHNASVIDLRTIQYIPDEQGDSFGCIDVNGMPKAFRQKFPIICQAENSTYNTINEYLRNYINTTSDVYFTAKRIHQTQKFNIYSVVLYTNLNDNTDFRINIPLIQKVKPSFLPKIWYENCNVINKDEDGTYTLITKPPFSSNICFTFNNSKHNPVEVKGDIVIADGITYKKTYEIPTLHTFAFSGFFKPTLPEVYVQMPPDFNENNKFLISTNIISPNNRYICIQGDYHVAITEVWVES